METPPLKILIVEDDIAHSTAIRRALKTSDNKYDIEIVDSLQGFHEHAAQQSPDVAIMDLNLPDGRAVEVLTSPAEDGLFPILLMTSYGNEQVAVEAIKAGALDYIVKSPEAFALMAGTLERALREWKLLLDKKNVEKQLRESQAQVIQQEKMASIGFLAAGVAHEINNPIGYITSNLNSLRKYTDKLISFIESQEQAIQKCADQATRSAIADLKQQISLDYLIADLHEMISETMEGSRRVSKIVQELQSFARADGNEAVCCNLTEVIRNTASIVSNELKYVAELVLQLSDLPPVLCRPQQIGQVVMNLLINAAHSVNGNGLITLATAQIGDSVEISVADNGCGIPSEYLGKIFEPFFTTKDIGKGTGLGLAISFDIVKRHGGDLLVQSTVGVGTTFTIRLPIDPENSFSHLKDL
ncbi:MAG: response regulator [Desulfuromonadales bacterium]|nr:response regulator [Desulfuromonadales bacterium]